ncbi:hypothetical protein, partial [Heyndrickxia coagulans]|uniref:hypothetical protein n=1 Tax=Heyndrickxia coagulans TaxID=1398 RepID=UPI00214D3F46|nr:hypothetical protein [Heyndrickxia coagulans]
PYPSSSIIPRFLFIFCLTEMSPSAYFLTVLQLNPVLRTISESGMCKILLEGQMSGKKWEDALSFKCTLVGEYI